MSFTPQKDASSILNAAQRITIQKLQHLTSNQKKIYTDKFKRAPTRELKDQVLRNARTADRRRRKNMSTTFENARNNTFEINMNNKFENAKNNTFEINKNTLNKIEQDFKRSLNVNTTVNRNQSENLANKLKPEFVQALQTNTTKLVNLSVQKAKAQYPGVKWDIVVRDEITPFANKIRAQLTTGNITKAIASVFSLYATYYLLQKDPGYMTRLTNSGIRKMTEVLPWLTPISNQGSPQWKRMLSLVLTSANPSKEQTKYETMFATLPGNRYGRSSIGLSTQYLSILMTAVLSVIPWDKTQISTKFVFAILQMTKLLAKEVYDTISATTVQRTASVSGIGWRVFAGAITSVGTMALR